jgi:hypothetical protein
MTPEQQRIAMEISEVCGTLKSPAPGLYQYPRYPVDLNAMHDAEKMALLGPSIKHRHLQAIYSKELFRVIIRTAPEGSVSEFDKIHATAAQRAEAFLRTIGKWVES